MQVDPKEAARRLRAWNEYGEGADSGTPNEPGYTHDSLDFQRDLRALLSERDAATARAEGAEAVADQAVGRLEDLLAEGATLTAQRDAAIAERDRVKAALKPFAHRAEEAIALVGKDAEPIDLLVKAIGGTNWTMFDNARAALGAASAGEAIQGSVGKEAEGWPND